MTKKNNYGLLGKMLNLSGATLDKIAAGSLSGGSSAAKDEEPIEEEEKTEGETEDKAEEEYIPTFADVVKGIRDALRDPEADGARAETADKIGALADRLDESATKRAESAAEKSDEVYRLLAELGAKQSTDYGALADFIRSGDYLSTPAAKALLESYLSAAGVASDNAAADSAASNGGNADSYGAANAHRQRLSYTDAAHRAALELYERQADRLASLIKSAGGDLSDIYSKMQDNADGDADVAAKSVDDVSTLLRDLLADGAAERELDRDTLGKLFEEYADRSDTSVPMSPMALDKEYDSLKRDGLSGTDALIELWARYPDMREYIADKYADVLRGDSLYIFKD